MPNGETKSLACLFCDKFLKASIDEYLKHANIRAEFGGGRGRGRGGPRRGGGRGRGRGGSRGRGGRGGRGGGSARDW